MDNAMERKAFKLIDKVTLKPKPIVGVSTSFTGKYQASQIIIRFLELLDIQLFKSTVTKPAILEAGTTLASADFCLPLRVYIGHIYNLLQEHPEINYLLAPIIKGEHPESSTCAKYRDLDGVIIRSLGSMTGYHLLQSKEYKIDELNKLVGNEIVTKLVNKQQRFPIILAPEIESLNRAHMRQVCFKLYAQLFKLNTYKKARIILSNGLDNSTNKELKRLERAFDQAYHEVVEAVSNKYERFIRDPQKMRLAILGRSYLVNDPAITADVKGYFKKKGVAVITIQDIPFKDLEERYRLVNGFYDYHRIGQAFIDKIIDDVDGFVVLGSFGCHPDAFQVEYFAKYITERGKTSWSFKFDEQTGGTGFHTRFETILGFLEKKRDERLKGNNQIYGLEKIDDNRNFKLENKPLFIWPYMGTGINLIIKEIWNQLGLENYMYSPKPVNEDTIVRGEIDYTETCSPFALYLGSLRDSLDTLLSSLEEEAINKGNNNSSRRIIILMAGGKGPCTFGWYSIAGMEILEKEYASRLKEGGHTLEMIAIDNQGRNLVDFLQELATVAENNKLQRVIDGIKILEKNSSKIRKTQIELLLIKLLKDIVWSGWVKLLAFEEIQNHALVVRAHEVNRGTTTRVLKKWVEKLEAAHSIDTIDSVKKEALLDLSAIEQDNIIKPKVVIVGEIYVSLTPFANRGTVDNLLGALGLEAIEGMRLSHFIKGAFKSVKYSFIHNQPMLKPIFQLLEAKGLYSTNQWVRDPLAKPFLKHEVGGDGQPTVARARYHIENDGVDGILHIYPFKCMPEGIAKDALIEMSQLYGVKSLHLSFSKETDIERLKTELGTFAALLHESINQDKSIDGKYRHMTVVERRKEIGKKIESLLLRN